MLSVGLGEHLVPKFAGLLEVGVGVLVLVSSGQSVDLLLSPGVLAILLGTILSVGLVINLTSFVAVDNCSSISLVVVNSCSVRTINWNLLIV